MRAGPCARGWPRGCAHPPPQHRHGHRERRREQPMIELDRRHVVEEVLPPRRRAAGSRAAQDVAVHQRKRVVREAGANAGDEAAGDHHEQHEADHRDRAAPRAYRAARDCDCRAATAATARPTASRRGSRTRGLGARSAGTATRADRRPARFAPCTSRARPAAPPSTKMPASLPAVARRNRAAQRKPQERDQEHDADQRGRAGDARTPTRRCA